MGDVPVATAILDRFLQDAELIEITGRSYRLRGKSGHESKPAKPDHRCATNKSAHEAEK
ncbi:ATP-binding protein [Bythopirellula goksoeyrii]|uniref:ATP-binding protein n=1 Tax=Bythopirellula goksoeyrii TaxID=1400387 RepID=UPI0036F42ABF